MVSQVLLLLALAQNPGAVEVADANHPQPASVCQILENLRAYDGKVVAIQVVNLNLAAKCQAPQSTDDPRLIRVGEPPVNELAIAPFTDSTALAGPLGRALHDYERWLKQGYDISMKIIGRIEVRPEGSPVGLGHLGGWPVQITITQIEELKRSAKKGPKRKKTIIIE